MDHNRNNEMEIIIIKKDILNINEKIKKIEDEKKEMENKFFDEIKEVKKNNEKSNRFLITNLIGVIAILVTIFLK